MDKLATNFGFITKLNDLADTHPIGVASAYSSLHDRLVEVVDRLGSNLGEELVGKVAKIRAKIGIHVGEDYESELQEYRLRQDEDYFIQRGHVAAQLLSDLKPEPFKAENDLTLDQLKWIIPSLRESTIGDGYTPELREASALMDAITGHPTVKSELKFLMVHEILFSRVRGYVPTCSLLGYWQSLKPTTEAGIRYHAAVEEILISMPPQIIPETAFIESSLIMLEAVSETICASSRDWETRALSEQSVEYIKDAVRLSSDRIRSIASKGGSELSDWEKRCNEIIGRVTNLPKEIPTVIYKHYELTPDELSAYSENFDEYDEPTILALASAGC